MARNGVRVHIPADHSDAAADNRGYVLAMRRVGDRLMALCQFIGADAVRDASRNQVSIGVAPTFVDGKERIYHDAIVHVALTPVPVVPGQGAFFSIQRRADMAHTMLPCSEETLASLHELVPGLREIPEDQKLDHVLQHVQSTAGNSDQADLSLAGELAPLDPAVAAALIDAVKSKRDLCVSRGALTPAVADALLSRLVPKEGLIALSHNSAESSAATLALSIFSALADNKPVAGGERTGSQARALTRNVPGESQPSGPPLYEKMAAMANGACVQL
jgi:hypothetical protein